MADAVTQEFEELVIEISDDGGSNWSKICGVTEATVTRTANIDSSEIPDCSDESIALAVSKRVRSREISISGTGVWSASAHSIVSGWFYSDEVYLCRVQNTQALTGAIVFEQFDAILASMENQKTKGQVVSAQIEIQSAGRITTTDAA